uniref:Uncharacterized protein n=1 Tax=Trichogramma kaykai TaxID=54128 RepID=A0ABD2W1G3_9HYME
MSNQIEPTTMVNIFVQIFEHVILSAQESGKNHSSLSWKVFLLKLQKQLLNARYFQKTKEKNKTKRLELSI